MGVLLSAKNSSEIDFSNITNKEYHVEAGRLLAQEQAEEDVKHSQRQWKIGEWYKSIDAAWGLKDGDSSERKNSTRLEACEEVGIDYQWARQCATVVKKFVGLPYRLPFDHLKALSTKALSGNQREDLAKKAESEGWTQPELRSQIRILIGTPRKLVSELAKAEINEIIDSFPKAHRAKARAIATRYEREFLHAVHENVSVLVKQKQEELNEEMAKYRRMSDNIGNAIKKINQIMSKDEFNLIRNCLHPDRAPEDRRDKFNKAFTIFNRLLESIPKYENPSNGPGRGWNNKKSKV